MPPIGCTTANGYQWAAPGDVNAFFGLMLDNVANLVLMVGLLAAHFDFDATFALRYMIPPTALGVLAWWAKPKPLGEVES